MLMNRGELLATEDEEAGAYGKRTWGWVLVQERRDGYRQRRNRD